MWDILIITGKHKPPLTASSPSFNITLIFHLWLLIQSFIINKHTVNVAIIASSLRLDYLRHRSFTIAAAGKSVGKKYCMRLSDLPLLLKPISSAKCVCVRMCVLHTHMSVHKCDIRAVREAPLKAASHHNVNKNHPFSLMCSCISCANCLSVENIIYVLLVSVQITWTAWNIINNNSMTHS